MNRLRIAFALIAPALVLAAAAIEPPAPDPKQPPQQEPEAKPEPAPDQGDEAPAGDEPPAGEEAPADAEALPPLPAGAPPAEPPPQRFNPTEKVRADFPVSFPIDI